MLHDQGDDARDHQQQRQAAEAVAAAVMAVAKARMMAMAVMMMVPMPMSPVAAVFRVAGFVERKFVSDPDIYFAHSVSLLAAGMAAEENIIKNSSHFKLIHQIIIILC
jgi:hypothetical protein